MDISREDILDAMQHIQGYIDITVEDFHEVYRLAYAHALGRLLGNIEARGVMRPDPPWVEPEMSLEEAASVMAEAGVAATPVLDPERRVVGMLSQSDYLRRLQARSCMGFLLTALSAPERVRHELHALRVHEVMGSPAVTIGAGAGLAEMLALFRGHTHCRVPVVDGEGRLLGLLARADLVGACRLGVPE